jgi:hypothetical protein
MVLQVQAAAPQVAGLKLKSNVIVMPRLACGAPEKVKAPHGVVGVPQLASSTTIAQSRSNFLIIDSSFDW